MNSKKPQRKMWLTVRLPADDWTVIEEAVADGIFAMTMHGGATGRMAQVNRGFKRALSQARKKRQPKKAKL